MTSFDGVEAIIRTRQGVWRITYHMEEFPLDSYMESQKCNHTKCMTCYTKTLHNKSNLGPIRKNMSLPQGK